MKPSNYSMWNPNAWTSGMNKEPGKVVLKSRFMHTALTVPKREMGYGKKQTPRIENNNDFFEKISKEQLEPLIKADDLPSDNHINGLSNFISQMLGHQQPERGMPMGYAAVRSPSKINSQNKPPAVFIGDYNKFGEKFQETAEEKFGWDTFRKYETPPDFVVKEFEASNAKSALNKVWPQTRKRLGFEGDCRFPWEKVNDMSLAELITSAIADDFVLPNQSEIMDSIKTITSLKVSEELLESHKKLLSQAQKRLSSLKPESVKSAAATLSHSDLTPIRNWGQDIDLARVESLKALKENTIKTALHTNGELGQTNEELAKLLKAKPRRGLSGIFYKAFSRTAKPVTRKGRDSQGEFKVSTLEHNYRAMDDEQRKVHEERLVEQLEDVMRNAMQSEEERIVYAEDAALIVEHYQTLLQRYARELKKNRTRLLSEAQNEKGFNAAAQENVVVSRDKKKRVEEAIDDRLDALDESIEICNRERLHYESLAALHQDHKKNLRVAVNHSIEQLRNFERMEQQVKLTQNIALAGQYAANLNGMKLEKQMRVVSDRLREARAEHVEKIANMKRAMDTDEILVLDHQKPVALIEYQRTVALLPAPTDEEKSKVEAPTAYDL